MWRFLLSYLLLIDAKLERSQTIEIPMDHLRWNIMVFKNQMNIIINSSNNNSNSNTKWMKASNHCIRLLDDFVEQIKNDQRFNISLIFSSASGPFHYAMYTCISAGYSIFAISLIPSLNGQWPLSI